MKNKQLETLLYSTVGVALVLVATVAVNVIAGWAKARVDLTAEKAYTLSAGTKAILQKLDTPIVLRFYFNRSDDKMPAEAKVYAQQVEDLLEEYVQAGGGKIKVEKYDPQPDSDAEDKARFDGVEGQMNPQNGGMIYLGLSVRMLDQVVALPVLIPSRERLLEYDLSRAITQVVTPEKPVIGVMTPLQIFGQPAAMRRFNQGQPSEPWTFVSELKRDFEVKQVPMTADHIDDNIKVLLVVHPKEIGDPTQFALDQFVLRGGKLIAFLDPNCYFDDQKQNAMMGMGGVSGSSLDKLLKAWGLKFEGKVVADANFKTATPQGDAPAILSLTSAAMNKEDILSGQIDTMLLPYAGVFEGTPADGLKKVTLLKTSTSAGLLDPMMASFPGEAAMKEFKEGGKEYDLALRLTGKFKTAFPNGKPTPGKNADAEKKDEKSADAPALKEGKAENAVILVGDSDFLHDIPSVQVQNFLGQRMVSLLNGNLPFVQGMVEQMGGDENLIAVRSRATLNRPFIRVQEMQAKAAKEYQGQIQTMEETLQEAQRRVSELQQAKSKDQRSILSPEQQKEIESFRKKQAETNKSLKELRKKLRQDVDSLENTIKWTNILAMPLAVIAVGLVLAFAKRKRTAAK